MEIYQICSDVYGYDCYGKPEFSHTENLGYAFTSKKDAEKALMECPDNKAYIVVKQVNDEKIESNFIA